MWIHNCGIQENKHPYHETGLNPLPCLEKMKRSEGNSLLGRGSCKSPVYGWAVGGDSAFEFPKDVGYEIGANSVQYIILEIHLTDIMKESKGIEMNNSGFKLFTTTKPMKYNSGVMLLGDVSMSIAQFTDPFTGKQNKNVGNNHIPGGYDHIHYETTCPSACTQSFSSSINIFYSFLHMHKYGKEMWSTHLKYNNRSEIESRSVIDSRQFWNFGLQSLAAVNTEIKPGDAISTHCVYDTSKIRAGTSIGQSTNQEMCLYIIAYYPAMPISKCGYKHGYSVCSPLWDSTNSKSKVIVPNPIPDGDMTIPNAHFCRSVNRTNIMSKRINPTNMAEDATINFHLIGKFIIVIIALYAIGSIYIVYRKKNMTTVSLH